ncbi:uncharacterized protein LOC111402852 [Olea europaea var. sylvestris]|uniref:uncharacterized protein LOC111402852 n=1 Tax=Olea europaea var. sylvestris TaxID=158386 RepID=UPI000C1CEC58|nr:uncharacterized protein LOC111402852 [Olea europaea var. sylvestris]
MTLKDHVSLFDSSHNQAFAKCTNLMNQKQSISYVISSQSSSQQQSYRTRLTAVLDCTRLLLMQGLSFRGHDESKESLNRENLIELLNWYVARCKAPDNSVKEQMTVVLRFVDKSGQVKERFLGMSHVTDTCVQSLKDAIDAIFSTHGLSISSLRDQGYDRASNMLARRNCMLGDFLDVLAIIVNLVGASCKRVDALRTSYQANILEKLNVGELTGGSGQFQEMSLTRPGDTRWGLHLLIVTRLINMFNAIIDVLENLSEDGVHSDKKSSALR